MERLKSSYEQKLSMFCNICFQDKIWQVFCGGFIISLECQRRQLCLWIYFRHQNTKMIGKNLIWKCRHWIFLPFLLFKTYMLKLAHFHDVAEQSLSKLSLRRF